MARADTWLHLRWCIRRCDLPSRGRSTRRADRTGFSSRSLRNAVHRMEWRVSLASRSSRRADVLDARRAYDMCPEGRSVYAYVLDTGVRTDHEQFNLNEPSDRVVLSRTFDDGSATGQIDTTNGCSSNTNQWHGTAVASVLAGTTIGASKTQIVSLRVFDCFLHTQLTWLLNALHWIRSTNDHYAGMPGVVNLSSGLDPTSLR